MEISVRQTNIKPTSVRQLLANGILLVSHLNKFDVPRLAQKTRLNVNECEKILAAIKPKRPHYIMRASELMIKPFERIPTNIEGIDSILGGGIRCGHITEISGEAGAGKSNLCAQIGVSVMKPQAGDQTGGEVILIHTEGEGKLKLAIKRFCSLAAAVGGEDLINSKLHLRNCSNEFELIELINRLPENLEQNTKIKLVIIDSIICAFISAENSNPDYEFYAKRSLRLTKLVKLLYQLAWNKRLPIIVTNHVSYNFKWGQNRPAMGKVWSHMCQTKIYLERIETGYEIARFAHVTKGALNNPSAIPFKITS